ncbi:MAG: BlaI/MecI/CopY family transcriptional regulator, partial [bacterium]
MAHPNKPKLTGWETKLMHYIWDRGHATADDIREALRAEGLKRSDSAIRKILRGMEDKGAISHTVEHRTFIYTSNLKRHQVQGELIRYLSALLFQGSAVSLALRALDESDLSPEV